MGKKLAIRGHSTRGKEVIELLEMMGGKISNECTYESGFDIDYFFFICEEEKNLIDGIYYEDKESLSNYICFTLEEFLEKYPFKVGDKVNQPCRDCVKTITSMKWDEYLNTVSYKLDNKIYTRIEQLKVVNDLPHKETNIKEKEDKLFDSIIWHLRNSINNGKQHLSGGECEEYFREVVNKNNENKMKNVLAELLEHIKTTPKEELEKEFNELEEWSNIGPTVEEFMTFCGCVNKRSKYPKTIDECVKLLGVDFRLDMDSYKRKLMANFYRLILCRDAYWKVAGEQMGLGKSWEPDWKHGKDKFYCICTTEGEIVLGEWYIDNKILAFPTEKMRDAFYGNFKDLIEQCKELL